VAKKPILKPGQKATVSGQYGLQGPRGGSGGREATIVQGEPAPPTPKSKMTWKLVDPTKHKRP
jgi:hypothetical protein